MSKYKKPTCECGGELVWWKQVPITITRKINKSGRVREAEFHERLDQFGNYARLQCESCHSEYDFDTDYMGRVIIGAKYKE